MTTKQVGELLYESKCVFVNDVNNAINNAIVKIQKDTGMVVDNIDTRTHHDSLVIVDVHLKLTKKPGDE